VTSPALDQEVSDPASRADSRGAFATRVSWLAARGALPVLAFSAIYLAATTVLALRRPLWNDELYTYYFARVPGAADLWRALETGADQAPPLSYLLTRASFSVLGVGSLSIRLPEILAFLLFCICTYVFVARRTNQLYGVMAMFLPTLTAAYYYASEARAYALVLGFGALALLCWQLATEGVRRRVALVGLAAALALAVSSHYYALLLLVPLGLGELARAFARRRIDVAVWAAFTGALLPLAAFVQLIRASHSYSTGFWGRPAWLDPLRFFSFLLDPRVATPSVMSTGRPTERGLVLLAVGLLISALVVVGPLGPRLLRRRGRTGSNTLLVHGPPNHEVVAAAAFLLLPLAGVVVGKAVTDAYAPRYALSAVIGVIVLPFALYRLEGRRPIIGWSVVTALAVAFFVAFVAHEHAATRWSADQRRTLQFLERNAPSRVPILIDNPHQYLELSYASPPSFGGRLIYVANPSWDSTQRGLLALGRIAHLRVYNRNDVAALSSSLLAFSSRREADWSDTRRRWSILPALKAEGRAITTRAIHGEQALYEISASPS
jgi:hypothetical protein